MKQYIVHAANVSFCGRTLPKGTEFNEDDLTSMAANFAHQYPGVVVEAIKRLLRLGAIEEAPSSKREEPQTKPQSLKRSKPKE